MSFGDFELRKAAMPSTDSRRRIPPVISFLIVYAISALASAIPVWIYTLVRIFSPYMDIIEKYSPGSDEFCAAVESLYDSLAMSRGYMLTMLFSTFAMIAATVIYCRFAEHRSLFSMGFRSHGALTYYIVGAVCGISLTALSVWICCITGAQTPLVRGEYSVGIIIAFMLAYMIQGAAEEIFIHGFFMVSMSTKYSLPFSVIASSTAFSLLHISNNGVSPIAFLNLFLFATLNAIIVILTNQIWFSCAMHAFWNFAQGNIFGQSVSGFSISDSVFTAKPQNHAVINGGAFGPEGGLAVTLVMLLSFIVISLIYRFIGKPAKRKYKIR